MTWAAEEFAGAQLGDARLNHRLIKPTERFADKPKRPLKWETVLAPHIELAAARMRQHRVVLCLQGTTELDFNGQSIEGLGPLSYEAQRGMYLHPTYAVTPEREPLGITDARMWARTPK